VAELKSYTELRRSPRISLADAAPLAAPLTVYIEPTNRCNLACTFCPQSLDEYEDKAGKRQDMSIGLYEKLISEIDGLGITSLKLYFFGEPFLHPYIGLMMRLATNVCDRVELTTNGLILTAKNCQAILDAGVHYLRVSVYPEARPALVARNVALLAQMREEQGKSLPVICAKVFSLKEKHQIEVLYAGIVEEIMIDGLHTIASEFVQISQQGTASHVACPYPFYNLVVKSNGDVVPCCVAWEDSLIVGNANHQTLAEIWAGEPLARIHRLHLEGRRGELAACAKCDTLFGCPDKIDSLTVAEYDRRRSAQWQR
jgi:radical SAM protein with 4Fe4S-binding SPASM domain